MGRSTTVQEGSAGGPQRIAVWFAGSRQEVLVIEITGVLGSCQGSLLPSQKLNNLTHTHTYTLPRGLSPQNAVKPAQGLRQFWAFG